MHVNSFHLGNFGSFLYFSYFLFYFHFPKHGGWTIMLLSYGTYLSGILLSLFLSCYLGSPSGQRLQHERDPQGHAVALAAMNQTNQSWEASCLPPFLCLAWLWRDEAVGDGWLRVAARGGTTTWKTLCAAPSGGSAAGRGGKPAAVRLRNLLVEGLAPVWEEPQRGAPRDLSCIKFIILHKLYLSFYNCVTVQVGRRLWGFYVVIWQLAIFKARHKFYTIWDSNLCAY